MAKHFVHTSSALPAVFLALKFFPPHFLHDRASPSLSSSSSVCDASLLSLLTWLESLPVIGGRRASLGGVDALNDRFQNWYDRPELSIFSALSRSVVNVKLGVGSCPGFGSLLLASVSWCTLGGGLVVVMLDAVVSGVEAYGCCLPICAMLFCEFVIELTDARFGRANLLGELLRSRLDFGGMAFRQERMWFAEPPM